MNGRALILVALVSSLVATAGGAAAGSAPRLPTLAYANDAHGNLDVYVATDGTARRLTSSRRDEFSPAWSPDGRYIAYRVNPPRSDEGEIWVMRADGTGKRNLTRSSPIADWSPAWSADGRLIAYFSMAEGGGDIWVMRADGSRKRNVTRNGGLNEYPTWSPDGRRLAFNSHRDGQFEIYRSGADGSAQRNLTRNPADDQWPAWSPEGRTIAFMSERAGNQDVFVMRADGSGVRNITRTPKLEESHPAWMADGRLSFIRHAETGPVELWALDLDQAELRRLPTDVQAVFTFDWKSKPIR